MVAALPQLYNKAHHMTHNNGTTPHLQHHPGSEVCQWWQHSHSSTTKHITGHPTLGIHHSTTHTTAQIQHYHKIQCVAMCPMGGNDDKPLVQGGCVTCELCSPLCALLCAPPLCCVHCQGVLGALMCALPLCCGILCALPLYGVCSAVLLSVFTARCGMYYVHACVMLCAMPMPCV